MKQLASLDMNQNIKVWKINSLQISDHITKVRDIIAKNPQSKYQDIDMVLLQHFPQHIYN